MFSEGFFLKVMKSRDYVLKGYAHGRKQSSADNIDQG